MLGGHVRLHHRLRLSLGVSNSYMMMIDKGLIFESKLANIERPG